MYFERAHIKRKKKWNKEAFFNIWELADKKRGRKKEADHYDPSYVISLFQVCQHLFCAKVSLYRGRCGCFS